MKKAFCALISIMFIATSAIIPMAASPEASQATHEGTLSSVTALFGTAPTVDGLYDSVEWSGADASYNGTMDLFVKHDATMAYFCAMDTTDNIGSPQFGQMASFLFDLNNDDAMSPVSDDRRFKVEYAGSWTTGYFAGFNGSWNPAATPPGASLVAAYDVTYGCWVYECAIPLSELNSYGTFSADGDVVGFGVYGYQDGNLTSTGWPSGIPGDAYPMDWGALYLSTAMDIEPNDDPSSAPVIAPGTLDGAFHQGDVYDYFAVVLSRAGQTLYANVTVDAAITVDVYIYTYAVEMTTEVASRLALTASTARLNYCFADAQTVYVCVSKVLGLGGYTLQTFVVTQNDAGTGGDAANDIAVATIASEGSYGKNILRNEDQYDYFSLNLPSPGMTVYANATVGIGTTLNLHLYDSAQWEVNNSMLITAETGGVRHCFALAQTVYVLVRLSSGGGFYSLELAVVGQDDGDKGVDAGNDFPLATVVAEGVYTGNYLGGEDEYDYYRLTLTQSGQTARVYITAGAGIAVDLFLYDSSTFVVADYPYITESTGSVSYCFGSPGFFYFLARLADGQGYYALDVSILSQNDAGTGLDAGDGFDTSTHVTPGLYEGNYLRDDDSYDYYDLSTSASGQTVEVTVSAGIGTMVDLVLCGSGRYEVASALSITDGSGTASYCFDTPQTVYFFVRLTSGYGTYSAQITLASQNDAGSGMDAPGSFLAALLIAEGSYAGNELVGEDSYDYYKLPLNASGQTVSVSVTPAAGLTVDLVLYSYEQFEVSYYMAVTGDSSGTVEFCFDVAQTVYFVVRVNSGEGLYGFTVGVASQNDAGTGGDATSDFLYAEAVPYGVYFGYMKHEDADDWYKATIPSGETLSVDVTLISNMSVNLYLLDAGQYFLSSDYADFGGTASVNRTAETTETVWIHIQLVSGGGDYEMDVRLPSSGVQVPGMPLDTAATTLDGMVSLTWEAPLDDGGSAIQYYNIYRSASMLIEGLPFDTVYNYTWYADHAVENGVTYYYTVTAVNVAGEGPMAAVVSATPSAGNTAPGVPADPSPADGATGVALDVPLSVMIFDANGDYLEATFYDVVDEEMNETSVIGMADGLGNGMASITWRARTAGTEYFWRVRVRDSVGAVAWSPVWSFRTTGGQVAASLKIIVEASYLFTGETLTGNAVAFDGEGVSMGMVGAVWSLEVIDATGASIEPSTGESCTLTAGETAGTVIWFANYGELTASRTIVIAEKVSVVMGAAGGNMTYGAVKLSIPAGALLGDVLLTAGIVPTNGTELNLTGEQTLAGPVCEFGPSGTVFLMPVTLTLEYNQTLAPTGATLAVFYWDEANGTWVQIEGCFVDPVNGTVSGDVWHFSRYSVLATEENVPPNDDEQTTSPILLVVLALGVLLILGGIVAVGVVVISLARKKGGQD